MCYYITIDVGQLVYFVTNIEGLRYQTFTTYIHLATYIHPAHIEILKLTETGEVDKIKPLIDDIRYDVFHTYVGNSWTIKNILELSKIDYMCSHFYFKTMNENDGWLIAVVRRSGGKISMVNVNIQTQDNVKKWRCYYVEFIPHDMK